MASEVSTIFEGQSVPLLPTTYTMNQIFIMLDVRTILGHSEIVSTMEKHIADNLQHQMSILRISIPWVSTAIAIAKRTFPGEASSPNAGHLANRRPLCQKANHSG